MNFSSVPLYEAFLQIPDPRNPSGRRHALASILTLTTVSMLCGCRGLYAIAQFGRDHGESLSEALGFGGSRTPCCATLHYLFKALDVDQFETILRRWLSGQRHKGWKKVAIDGKTLRGVQGDQLPGVHLLAAYESQAGQVLGQLAVDCKTNEYKAAFELLNLMPVQGTILTGDAMFCHRELSRKVKEKKANMFGKSKITNRS